MSEMEPSSSQPIAYLSDTARLYCVACHQNLGVVMKYAFGAMDIYPDNAAFFGENCDSCHNPIHEPKA